MEIYALSVVKNLQVARFENFWIICGHRIASRWFQNEAELN